MAKAKIIYLCSICGTGHDLEKDAEECEADCREKGIVPSEVCHDISVIITNDLMEFLIWFYETVGKVCIADHVENMLISSAESEMTPDKKTIGSLDTGMMIPIPERFKETVDKYFFLKEK